jgi:UDP-N-acetylmuramoyl-tripeptide--D-alanyl-D-alanine ligase
MSKFTSTELAGWVSGSWSGRQGDFPVAGVCHDTRTLKAGEVYIAIRGASHDGHAFVSQAIGKGAAGLIVEREIPDAGVPQLIVPDTMKALRLLAAGVRQSWKGTVIGITGSVGKTTVKEMIASVLAQKGTVAKTPGNWNNEIGLPLSMLAADRKADFFVFELGMNHPGEIDRLASLLRPDWGVLTEIGKAHIEFFDNGLEGIANEKASLLAHAAHALLDETSEWIDLFLSKCAGQRVLFGTEPFAFTLPQPGEYMIRNARRAVALGRELGLTESEIQAGLSAFQAAPMRWQTIEKGGIVFINDAYNANPLSMRAALTAFAQLPCEGRKIAVLGGMRELGASSESEHRELGRFADSLNLDEIISVGEGGAQIVCKGSGSTDKPTAAARLLKTLRKGDQVLFKASRGEKLETILEDLIAKI